MIDKFQPRVAILDKPICQVRQSHCPLPLLIQTLRGIDAKLDNSNICDRSVSTGFQGH